MIVLRMPKYKSASLKAHALVEGRLRELFCNQEGIHFQHIIQKTPIIHQMKEQKLTT